jgi:beta-lactamase superfamily II metal-dependent hydrolase
MISEIRCFLKARFSKIFDRENQKIKRKKFHLSIIFVFLSLVISGCSTVNIETDIIENLTIKLSHSEINKNEFASLVVSSNNQISHELTDVKCVSSDEAIAAVINNKVYGLTSGTVNITCYVGDVISNSITATIRDGSVLLNDEEKDPDITPVPLPPPAPTDPVHPPTSPTNPTTPEPTPNPITPEPTPNPTVPPPVSPPISDKLLVVSYIDVGQGDSILIQTPNGSNILIDAGTSSYQTKVSNYLKARGITKIDVLIATHPHADHIGGMSYIIDNFDIGSIYMPKVSTTTKTYETLLTAIKNKGLLINTAKAGVVINIDSALSVKLIAPISTSYNDLNQYSAVTKITYGSISFLFMGDAGSASEQEILNSRTDLKADVLKVGHHGSSTSTTQTFLNAVSPKYAVICVGKNSYGHPTQEVINRLLNIGASILRTDLDGDIVISSDGVNIFVKK